MQTSGWLQLALYVIALAAITKPMGLYLMQVLDANGKTTTSSIVAIGVYGCMYSSWNSLLA